MENAQTIAKAIKRRVELIEGKNVIQAFSINECVTEEGKRDKAEFIGLARAVHLKRIKERLGLAAESSNRNATNNGNQNYTSSSVNTGGSVGLINSSTSTVPPLNVNSDQHISDRITVVDDP